MSDTPENQPPYNDLHRPQIQQTAPENNAPEENKNYEDELPKKPSAWKANIQLLIVLGFIIGGFVVSQTLQVEEEPQKQENQVRDLLVQTQSISPITKKIIFTRTGSISVNGLINIVPQVSGRVTRVDSDFNNGGVFDKNQTLFTIEQADFINALNIAKAQVEQARTALEIQKAESQASINEWNSINPSLTPPALVAKKPQLAQAQANLKAAQAQLADANLALNRTKFNYDFAGRIVDTTIEQGQFVQAGQAYGQAYPKDSLEIIVPVEDKILRYMDINESDVNIRIKYRGEDITLKGVADRIGSVLNQNTRFVDVVIKPKDDDWDMLIPGVFVEVDLIGKSIENVWEIPNEAMQGQSDIWIIREDNTLELYKPDIITTHPQTTDAIGNGQTVNIVLGLLTGASEGMNVRINTPTDDKNDKMGSAPPRNNKEDESNNMPITSPINESDKE